MTSNGADVIRGQAVRVMRRIVVSDVADDEHVIPEIDSVPGLAEPNHDIPVVAKSERGVESADLLQPRPGKHHGTQMVSAETASLACPLNAFA